MYHTPKKFNFKKITLHKHKAMQCPFFRRCRLIEIPQTLSSSLIYVKLFPRFVVLRFPSLLHRATFSSLAFSVFAFSAHPIHYQSHSSSKTNLHQSVAAIGRQYQEQTSVQHRWADDVYLQMEHKLKKMYQTKCALKPRLTSDEKLIGRLTQLFA